MKCPQCGNTIPSSVKFCAYCGSSTLARVSRVRTGMPAWLKWMIALSFIGVAGVMIFHFLLPAVLTSSPPQPKALVPTPAPTPQPSATPLPPLGPLEPLEQQAGISAYTNVGQTIDLSKARNAYGLTVNETSGFAAGLVSPSENIYAFVHEDGWIVVYYPRDRLTTEDIRWNKQQLEWDTVQGLTETLADVTKTLSGVTGNAKYYDFQYPLATKLGMVGDWLQVAGAGDEDSGDQSFSFTMPNDVTIYEGSWYHYSSGTYYGGSHFYLDTQIINATEGGTKWGRLTSKQLSLGNLHTAKVTCDRFQGVIIQNPLGPSSPSRIGVAVLGFVYSGARVSVHAKFSSHYDLERPLLSSASAVTPTLTAEPIPAPTIVPKPSDSELQCASMPLATASEGVTVSRQVERKAIGATWGAFKDVMVDEIEGARYAFAIAGSKLLVFDLANPNSPEVVSELELPEVASRLVASEGYVYVAAGSGLVIIDVIDPTHTKIVSQIQKDGLIASSIVVSGKYALVAGWQGVLTIDIQQPATPTVMSYLQEPAIDIFLYGKYGFLASGQKGLTVVDFSDVCAPQVISEFSTQGDARHVSIIDGYALVADHLNGLLVVDVSEPTSLNIVTKMPPQPADDVFVSGNTAFVMGLGRLWLFDVADPMRPVLQSSFHGYPELSFSGRVYVQGARAFVATGYDLGIIDVQLPSKPSVVAVTPTTAFARYVFVWGKYAFLTTGRGLAMIDIIEPTQPKLVTEFRMGYPEALNVSEKGYAFVLSSGSINAELVVVDVTDPSIPKLVSQVDMRIRSGTLFVSGDYAYITGSKQDSDIGQLTIMNIGDVLKPQIVGELELPFAPRKIYVRDGYIFLTRGPDNNNTGLIVIDAREPQKPKIISTIEMTYYRTDVFVEDGYAYVSYNGLTVYDVREPSNPHMVSRLTLSGTPNNVVIARGKAFMADGDKLWVIDIGDPANPRVVEQLDMVGASPQDVYVSEAYVFVTDSDGGLFIYPLP